MDFPLLPKDYKSLLKFLKSMILIHLAAQAQILTDMKLDKDQLKKIKKIKILS